MLLVAIAWIYVVLMMSVAEATASNGSVLGAFFTFALYGVLPLAIVLYLMASPARRKARLRGEARSDAVATTAVAPDRSDHAAGDPVTPERKEP